VNPVPRIADVFPSLHCESKVRTGNFFYISFPRPLGGAFSLCAGGEEVGRPPTTSPHPLVIPPSCCPHKRPDSHSPPRCAPTEEVFNPRYQDILASSLLGPLYFQHFNSPCPYLAWFFPLSFLIPLAPTDVSLRAFQRGFHLRAGTLTYALVLVPMTVHPPFPLPVYTTISASQPLLPPLAVRTLNSSSPTPGLMAQHFLLGACHYCPCLDVSLCHPKSRALFLCFCPFLRP